MTNVTHILNEMAQGDLEAAHQLMPLIYDELRQLAARKLAQEKPGQTLDATALVHEAWLRLVVGPGADVSDERRWAGRRHFFAAAAESMRRILVESARRKRALKRGGGRSKQEVDPSQVAAPERSDDLLALDEALDKLSSVEPALAELVKLRYFAGLTNRQAAEALGISPRTADMKWAFARAWLLAELEE